jgi:nitrate reductase delta subunit
MEENRLVLKLCSVLMEYPDEQWLKSKDIINAVATIEDAVMKEKLTLFLRYLQSISFKDLWEKYVKQFDFSDQTTLYLTYNIFGDNRERGQAFVQLKMEYAKAGFYLREDELPDYLPVILEFASMADITFVQKTFFIHKKSISRLHEKLVEQNSPYAHLLSACMHAFKNLLSIPMDHVSEGNVG